jgi:hypothetical protein
MGLARHRSLPVPLVPVRTLTPSEFDHADAGLAAATADRRLLAQGDSWFSLGSVPPHRFTNLLHALELDRPTAVVNCAHPGLVLRRMTDGFRARDFLSLLNGRGAPVWDGLLISGGGNDLIEAASSPPSAPPDRRLLRTVAERSADADDASLPVECFVSEPGWARFEAHLAAVIGELLAERDRGRNAGIPIVMHTYTHLQPTRVGTGFGQGPWLSPTLSAYGIAPARWADVARELIDRLATLLQREVAARPGQRLHLVDSRTVPVVHAAADATGDSGDFVNEIHLNRSGLAKVAAAWQPVIDAAT